MSQSSYKIPRVVCYLILFVCGVQGVRRFGLYSHIRSWNRPQIKDGVLVPTCGRKPGGKGSLFPFSFLFLFRFILFFLVTHTPPHTLTPNLNTKIFLCGLIDEDVRPVTLHVFGGGVSGFSSFLNGQMTA